jgi:hypothetical protein
LNSDADKQVYITSRQISRRRKDRTTTNSEGLDDDERATRGMAPIPLPDVLNSRIPSLFSTSISSPIISLAKRLPLPSPQLFRTAHSQLLSIIKRQSQNPNILPTTYGSINSGPAPGTVVGIVLGSVGGFLLILWLIYTCAQFGNVGGGGSSYTESVVVRDRRKSHGYVPFPSPISISFPFLLASFAFAHSHRAMEGTNLTSPRSRSATTHH